MTPGDLLTPAAGQNRRFAVAGVRLLLAFSALCLLFAPALMPEGYSWRSNAISESGAQNLEGAWLARLGLLRFGMAVLWLAVAVARAWARSAVWMHVLFGVSISASAAFAHRPWISDVPLDAFEDLLHSAAATAMGFAFTFGVLARLLQRTGRKLDRRAFDVLAIAAATVIPLCMLAFPAVQGLLQRVMFLIAYLWYAAETPLVLDPNEAGAGAP